MTVDSGCYEWVRDKAAYQVQLKYKINKSELHSLYKLNYFLSHKGRSIISFEDYIDQVTANIRSAHYVRGYLKGLLTKSYLGSFEYQSKPGSNCIGISDLGFSVLAEYEKQVKIVSLNYPKSDKESPPAYSLVEEPRASYKIKANSY